MRYQEANYVLYWPSCRYTFTCLFLYQYFHFHIKSHFNLNFHCTTSYSNMKPMLWCWDFLTSTRTSPLNTFIQRHTPSNHIVTAKQSTWRRNVNWIKYKIQQQTTNVAIKLPLNILSFGLSLLYAVYQYNNPSIILSKVRTSTHLRNKVCTRTHTIFSFSFIQWERK